MNEPQPITWEAIRNLIVELLAVEPEEVTPESNFFSDLGGESIDLIELPFKCQQAFGVRPEFQRLSASDWEVDENGVLLPESRQRLEELFPTMVGKLPTGQFHWHQLFTVAAIWKIIASTRESVVV